jgi:GNAT superfamily N-acetyltransferase
VNARVEIQRERADHPQVVALLDALDRYLGELYEPEAVDPALRGQRIGERLLQTLEASLKEQGVALSLLETGGDQREAVRLYERCGYTRRGTFGGYPNNGLSLFMAKVLA